MFYRAATFEVKHTERDFYLATFARARKHQGTPNWSPPEYVAVHVLRCKSEVGKTEGEAFPEAELANLAKI